MRLIKSFTVLAILHWDEYPCLTVRQIPFFHYPDLFKSHQDAFTSIFQDVGNRGAFIDQKDLKDFEINLANFLGAKYVVGVASGTDALILALRASGIGPGDEVIFCSHTFVATAAAIAHAGAVPVPVECSNDRLMDPLSVEKAITSRTKAILPTHLNGRVARMDKLMALAQKHNLLIIEDAAQACGAKFQGKEAGTFGTAGALSFYPAKTLGCLGDGGAVITDREDLAFKVRLLRDHGRSPSGEIVDWGVNARLDNLQAAFLDYKLKAYPQAIEKRRELAGLYHEFLVGLPEVDLPPPPRSDGEYFDIFQNYEIGVLHREQLRQFLQAKGIGTILPWGGKAVHQFSHLKLDQKLSYTEHWMSRSLLLPLHERLASTDIKTVASAIHAFYKGLG